MDTGILLSGAPSTGSIKPAFGPTGQIGVLLGLILALVVLSYIFSTVGYKRLDSK
ncbi:hypothetical protein ACEU6E_09075 [Halorutilales archaeon Cl-col2-1]